ncbi:MAG: hypothetical protein R3C32_09810 [Chloroflexota bacterium]
MESAIAPGDGSALAALGGAEGAADAVGTAQDELWVPVALLLLAMLAAEWLLYERDGARRIAQGVRARLVRTPPGRSAARWSGVPFSVASRRCCCWASRSWA